MLAFVTVNQYVLNFQREHPPDGPGIAILWLLFVSQVGIVSAVAARLVQKSWLGWVVYAWCWLLLDLQIAVASSYARGEGINTESLLLTALLAAQLGLVVIWSILGEQTWTIRVPLLLGLAVAITLLLGYEMRQSQHGTSYSQLLLLQMFGLYAICSLLRCRRLCLSQPDHRPRERTSPDWQFPTFRLGMREFVVVSVLFAVILVALQYSVYAWQPTANRPLNLAFAAVLTALTLAVAFWAAMGSAPIEVRSAGLISTCFLSAAGFIASDALFGEHYYRFHNSLTVGHFWSEAFASRGWVFAWMYLSGGLLPTALLLFRMLGYRLERVAPSPMHVADLQPVARRLLDSGYPLLAKER
jgi:hypothetical protein